MLCMSFCHHFAEKTNSNHTFFIWKSTELKKLNAKASWHQLGQECKEGGQEKTIYKITRFRNIQTSGSWCLGFLFIQKGDTERAASLTKTKNITFPESWLGCLHNAEFTLLRSALRLEGPTGVKSHCTSGLKDPQSPVSLQPGQSTQPSGLHKTSGVSPNSYFLTLPAACGPPLQILGFCLPQCFWEPKAAYLINRLCCLFHLPYQLHPGASG